jgi:superfamily I DNA/RNA helicase
MNHTKDVDAARLHPGPILLLAGPGTGKTHTLARRVKWLVDDQSVPPDSITLITFADEAARNMRERLSDPAKPDVFLPVSRQPGRICTMHSLAFGVVLENYEALGFAEPPGLLPSHLVKTVLGDAAELLDLPRDVGSQQCKVCREKGRCHRSVERDECRVCERYFAILKHHNVVDYDDQVLLACRVLSNDEQALAPYRESCAHLLVDEYQDINEAQFRLIKLLAGEDGTGLYAVGDDNQSIYSFRGGTPKYTREFARDWAGPTIHQLTESYRCPQPVIDAGASVIKNGCRTFCNDPQIHSNTGVDAPVTVNQVTSATQEARHIAQTIAQARGARDALILIPRSTYAG